MKASMISLRSLAPWVALVAAAPALAGACHAPESVGSDVAASASALSDDGDSLTLFIVPAPCNPTPGNAETCGIEFDNPGKLLLSSGAAAKNRTMVVNPDTGVAGTSSGLGHIYERVRCGERDIYTGQTGETDRAADYLKRGGFGLGLLFGVWPGTQQDTQHVLDGDDPAGGWPGLISRFKGVGPPITFVKWKISRSTCTRLLTFHDQFGERHYGRNYGLTLSARHGEGSGCTDMARSYVELAGLMSTADMDAGFQVRVHVERDWLGDQKGTSGPAIELFDSDLGRPMLAGSNASPYGPIVPGHSNVTLAWALTHFVPTRADQAATQRYVKSPDMDSWPGWAAPGGSATYEIRIGDPSFFRAWSLRLRSGAWDAVNPSSPKPLHQENVETNTLAGVTYAGYAPVQGVELDATDVPTPTEPIWLPRAASEVTALQADHCEQSYYKEHGRDLYVHFPDILETARTHAACDRTAFIACVTRTHDHYARGSALRSSYWSRHPEDDYTQAGVLLAAGDSVETTASRWYDAYARANLDHTDPDEFTHQPGYAPERKAPWVYPPKYGMYCHDGNAYEPR